MVSEFNQYLMSLENQKIYELAVGDSFTNSNEQQKNNLDHTRQL